MLSATDTSATTPSSDVRLLRSITLRNILSFGPNTPPLELRALNVLIGPNGSGKSNLLAGVELLRESATNLDLGLALGPEFLWKGAPHAAATVEAVVQLSMEVVLHRMQLEEIAPVTIRLRELLIREAAPDEPPPLWPYVDSRNGTVRLRGAEVPTERLNPDASLLVQLRDPLQNPELTGLAEAYDHIRLFREWGFGEANQARRPQRTDIRSHAQAPDGSNLALILNKLRRNSALKKQLLASLNELYEGVTDFGVDLDGGYARLYLQEGDFSIPTSRLSDGTLRYLFLLAILLDPTPPPLICLEEPELGLHPDAQLAVAKLIKEASERTQLLVTTHSDIIVDALSATPEDVVVCEKQDGQTKLTRLSSDRLKLWLETYSLGELWSSGQIGGNRW